MPKNSRNRKGKRPIRPMRGPDGRWVSRPDPEPPDDALQDEEAPITAGGLVIREPNPRSRAEERSPSTTMSSQDEAPAVRPASNSGRSNAERSRSHRSSIIAPMPTSNELPTRNRYVRVTAETITDEEAGPYRPYSPPVQSRRDSTRRPSPESEQRDSSSGNPAAQTAAQSSPQNETRFHSAASQTTAVNTSRFSRRSISFERVIQEHAARAEARAQSAYEQNRAALNLISQSMDNVRSAYTEARRARDRFHDILSVSSRARENVRRRTTAVSSSASQAERDTAGDVRRVADYQRRVRSQVLGSDELRELQRSPVSSWRLRSGMFPASLSRVVEGRNASMDLGTRVSTVTRTPSAVSRDMDTHRMGVREWVESVQTRPPRQPASERSSAQRAPSPVARAEEVLARGNPWTPKPTAATAPAADAAPTRTAGERVSWLDRLNQPSTSNPFARDPPPHHRPTARGGMAAGAPGGSPSSPYSSSSSTTTIRYPRTPKVPKTPKTPRRQGRPDHSSRDGSRVPEFLRTHRSPTFEPVAPGGDLTPAPTPNRRRATAYGPAPIPQFYAQGTPHGRLGPTDPVNRTARPEGTDKIVNMLTVAFIDEDRAAGRANTTPIHKLGIKASLPTAYEGQPDQTAFENWLALLLGFFRIHQLDVLNEAQDRARLEILGQSLKEGALTYFRERYQKFLESGEAWDFREAILDLRDRYLYKSTPFHAARKFETLVQGNRDAQALYDELSTQAARMIEYPSDYQFRYRFMMALRPEVLEFVIRNHSVSAENSTLAQIRSACEDFERSNEYGKQVAATQARLNGPRPSQGHTTSRSRPHHRSHTKAQAHSQHVHSNAHANKPRSAMARPSGEGSSKNPPTQSKPKHEPKAKATHHHEHKTDGKTVSCFICGGAHYARDCPPENRRAARGFAVRVTDEDPVEIPGNDAAEYHSAGSQGDPTDDELPGPDERDSGSERSDHPEGDQYDPDDAGKYQFSSDDDTDPVHARVTRIVATSALNQLDARAAKASKPTPPKALVVESNRARYKAGTGPQPQRNACMQRCIEVTVLINGLPARVLLDGGSNTNMISPEFAMVAKAPAIELQEQMTLQLAVTGSRSKINYGTWVPIEFGPVNATVYFDIANIEGYDAILGTPFLWEHRVSPVYEDDGWVMRDGKRITFPSHTTPTP